MSDNRWGLGPGSVAWLTVGGLDLVLSWRKHIRTEAVLSQLLQDQLLALPVLTARPMEPGDCCGHGVGQEAWSDSHHGPW